MNRFGNGTRLLPNTPPVRKPLYLARSRGFCAGVRRAVLMAEAALETHPPPIYCLNEIVHNRLVVERLERMGLRFVQEVSEAPPGAVLLFSAHGVSPAVRLAAQARELRVIDATCPFVTKVHQEVIRYARQGCTIVLIGKRGHDEIVGVAGEAPGQVVVLENADEARALVPDDPQRLAVVSQTTLSLTETNAVMAVLRERFPTLRTPLQSDICHATTDRQASAKRLAQKVGLIIVLGSPNSSNTLRLIETIHQAGARATLVDSVETLETLELDAEPALGLTAGASTPDTFLDAIIDRLAQKNFAPNRVH